MRDAQGNVVAMTDENARVLERIWYDAYGRIKEFRYWAGSSTLNSAGTVGAQGYYDYSVTKNPYLFQSQRLDKETGLYYFKNRYYDPETGRFITRDPAGDGPNLYAFVNNNPVCYVDPYGLYISDERENEIVAQANKALRYARGPILQEEMAALDEVDKAEKEYKMCDERYKVIIESFFQRWRTTIYEHYGYKSACAISPILAKMYSDLIAYAQHQVVDTCTKTALRAAGVPIPQDDVDNLENYWPSDLKTAFDNLADPRELEKSAMAQSDEIQMGYWLGKALYWQDIVAQSKKAGIIFDVDRQRVAEEDQKYRNLVLGYKIILMFGIEYFFSVDTSNNEKPLAGGEALSQ